MYEASIKCQTRKMHQCSLLMFDDRLRKWESISLVHPPFSMVQSYLQPLIITLAFPLFSFSRMGPLMKWLNLCVLCFHYSGFQNLSFQIMAHHLRQANLQHFSITWQSNIPIQQYIFRSRMVWLSGFMERSNIAWNAREKILVFHWSLLWRKWCSTFGIRRLLLMAKLPSFGYSKGKYGLNFHRCY